MRFLFITSTNLASNPRLVKELRVVLANGHKATVVQFLFNNWSFEQTNKLKNEFASVEFVEISALRSPFFPWFVSSVLQWFSNRIPLFLLQQQPVLLSFAVSKRSWLLLRALKKQNSKYDWVVAHNPATFYPAFIGAKRINSCLGIDIEDYHPGETHNPKTSEIMKRLMQYVLPHADYCSFAAPLIAAEVQKDIPGMRNQQLTILNGFPGNEFVEPKEISGTNSLRLVWFSQNIDFNRGLEEVIPAVNQLYPAVELHLVGSLKEKFASVHLQNRNGIVIHAPMSQKELHNFLSTCELGLSVDVPTDRNRELALTNKIIAFAQAGLPVLTYPIHAQLSFLKEYDFCFYVSENNQSAISNVLQKLDRVELHAQRILQFEKGKQLNWQLLSAPLSACWQSQCNIK